MDQDKQLAQITGLLIGTAVGDAVGLAREGLSPKRATKLFGNKIQHCLIVTPWQRIGLCSDDTEHAVMVGQCLLAMDNQPDRFSQLLAKHLRRWFLAFPAGLGMATLKACSKLCLGINPAKTGIQSAGNGAVMRAPIIGWFFADNLEMMQDVLTRSTLITHSDSRAIEGAWVIAMASSYLRNHCPKEAPINNFFNEILPILKGEELIRYLRLAREKLYECAELPEYLAALGLSKRGITGYVNYTVPAVIYAWLRYYGDYQKTIICLIRAGGDTDTNAAIAGALAGITIGEKGIPNDWVQSIKDWPMTISYIKELAYALANKSHNSHAQEKIRALRWSLLLVRNLAFLLIVFIQGFRRLLPPY